MDDADYMVMTPDGEVKIEYYCDNGYDGYTESFEQDEIIIEQCTGLKDKNGNLIYDGDILENGAGKRYFISWCPEKLGFVARTDNPNEVLESLEIYYVPWKVIGKITSWETYGWGYYQTYYLHLTDISQLNAVLSNLDDHMLEEVWKEEQEQD